MPCTASYSSSDGTCSIDTGDTAWLLFATTFVMLQTPATGLAQAGLVRRKNVVSLIVQSIVGVAWGSMLWMIIGYSLTFGPSKGGLIGNADFAFLLNIPKTDCLPTYSETIPAMLHVSFQMMFAIMTPVLVTGAWAEKFSFKAFLIFITLWPFFVYYPLAHWVWNACGWLMTEGVIDFAGGITIHTPAGISAVVVTYMMTGRRNHKELSDTAHSVPLTVLGGSLVWAGWYSFNGGSALSAGTQAVQALLNTQISACTGAVAWLTLDYLTSGKAKATGIVSGALAGLAGVTPGSGYQDVQLSFVCGLLVGSSAWYASRFMKEKLKKDDVLDVFSLQAVPGIIGSIFVGLSADTMVFLGPVDAATKEEKAGLFYGGNGHLLGVQIMAVTISALWTAFWTWIVMVVIKKTVGIEISASMEESGLDVAEYEKAYDDVFELREEHIKAQFPALMDSCKVGNLSEVEKLYDLGVDMTQADYDGRTPLHLAAAHGHVSIVKFLLEKNVDFNPEDNFGGTPIRDAAIHGRVDAVKFLSNRGAKIEFYEGVEKIILDAAAKGKSSHLYCWLMGGINVKKIADYDGRTPLHLAAANGHVHAVTLLLHFGSDKSQKDRWGNTPEDDARNYQFGAVLKELEKDVTHLEVIEEAIHDSSGEVEARGSDPESKMNADTREMLEAASNGNLKELKRLLKKRADPSCSDYDGRTPLHLAAAAGHFKAVKLLAFCKTTNINAMDRWHRTPLQEASRWQEIQNWLRKQGATVHDKELGYSLCLAASKGNVDSLAEMESHGKDLNCADYDGRTALHLAASTGSTEAIRFLLHKGANVNVKDRYGHTALYDALAGEHNDAAKLLESYGANVEGVVVSLTDAEQVDLFSSRSSTSEETLESVLINVPVSGGTTEK